MKDKIQQLKAELAEAIAKLDSADGVESFRINYLSKKGAITGLFKQLGSVPADQRPLIGKLLNELRGMAQSAVDAHQGDAQQTTLQKIDLTLPGRMPRDGRLHPLTQVQNELKQIFQRIGFTIADGPEVETDYLNFQALNIPKLHPARNMQDTLYISEELVLRTQTSSVQIRTMRNQQPPVRIIAPGRVYRRDTPDASHSPFFHQIEGLCVDVGVSLGDLKAILSLVAREMFGSDVKVRFRPSYFPFTEPSAEMDIWWESAKGGRWLELLGCGMVHPNVLREVNIDPDVYTGWAFGIGIDRFAMRKYGINDIRLLFENDMRFLEQF